MCLVAEVKLSAEISAESKLMFLFFFTFLGLGLVAYSDS
jgi:hypothetical protein